MRHMILLYTAVYVGRRKSYVSRHISFENKMIRDHHGCRKLHVVCSMDALRTSKDTALSGHCFIRVPN